MHGRLVKTTGLKLHTHPQCCKKRLNCFTYTWNHHEKCIQVQTCIQSYMYLYCLILRMTVKSVSSVRIKGYIGCKSHPLCVNCTIPFLNVRENIHVTCMIISIFLLKEYYYEIFSSSHLNRLLS